MKEKEVGIGAIKYFDLMHSVGSDVVFDWDKMMNLEGNSGPYLQYAYVRTQSLLDKAKKEKLQSRIILSEATPQELEVLRILNKYPEKVKEAARLYSPNILCTFLYELASKFNSLYNAERIIGSDKENFLLLLTSGVGQVLANGLHILGIDTPAKM